MKRMRCDGSAVSGGRGGAGALAHPMSCIATANPRSHTISEPERFISSLRFVMDLTQPVLYGGFCPALSLAMTGSAVARV